MPRPWFQAGPVHPYEDRHLDRLLEFVQSVQCVEVPGLQDRMGELGAGKKDSKIMIIDERQ